MSRVAEKASNDNGDWTEAAARCVSAMLRERGAGLEFAVREKLALDFGNEILRVALTRELQQIADAEAATVRSNGVDYRQHQRGTVTYHSLVGALRVTRWTYRACGVRNGPTIVALDARAKLVARATPALSYAVARGFACVPSRQLERDLVASARQPPSRSTLERMGKAFGAVASEDLLLLEREVRAQEPMPRDAVALTIGLDRTTVPMDEEAGRGTTHQAQYRMAYVGTATLTNIRGETLRSWRYAASAHDGPSTVQARMMSDVRKALRRRPDISLAIVQDGAPEMWNLIREELRRMRPVPEFLEVVDFYHLFQRLHNALSIIEPDERVRTAQIARWKKHLVTYKSGIERVQRYFGENWRGTFRKVDWSPKQERELRLALGSYLICPWFEHALARRRGHHIGSGVTEGACKSLIMARAKRSGQRWRPEGIRAVLTLRSLVVSDRFDSFWRLLLNRRANLEPLAA